jgi:hypothetical protein
MSIHPQSSVMEIESIAVICLVTLVVLIIQIIATFRLLLYFHHRYREKDEELALSTTTPSITLPPVPLPAAQKFPGSLRTYPRPLPRNPTPPPAPRPTLPSKPYAASSIYSVPTFVSNARDDKHPARPPWPNTTASSQECVPRAGSSDYDAHSESSTSDQALSPEKKNSILKKVFGRKPRAEKDTQNTEDRYWG